MPRNEKPVVEATEDQRLKLFLGICIPIRLGLAYAAKVATPGALKWMGIFAFIPAVLFFIVWLTNMRMGKGAFGGPVWWGDMRPIHAFIILLFALGASGGDPESWRFLAADALIGLAAFGAHKNGLI